MAAARPNKSGNTFVVQLNTGTGLDLATGKFLKGKDDKWYCNGGLFLTTGIGGRGNSYKSALGGSFMAAALGIYPTADAEVLETEHSVQDKGRYDELSPYGIPVSDRIEFINQTQMNLSDWLEYIKERGEEKIKNKKDLMVETPFFDLHTGKLGRIMTPTICYIDSLSKATGEQEEDLYDENKIDSNKTNPAYIRDGALKTKFMRMLPKLASDYGMYFIMTAHVKDQGGMGDITPPSKELQYMKQKDKFKNVGSDFDFLTTTLMQNWGATPLTNGKDASSKTCLYPLDGCSPVNELQEVPNIMLRCKNNASGTLMRFVVSQYMGLLPDVTNFHMLRSFDNYGLIVSGSKNIFTPKLLQDVSVNRNTLRNLLAKNYQLRRALELTAQICYIQNHWFLPRMPAQVRMDFDEIVTRIHKKGKEFTDLVLNSTSCWSYTPSERPYMSIMDLLDAIAD